MVEIEAAWINEKVMVMKMMRLYLRSWIRPNQSNSCYARSDKYNATLIKIEARLIINEIFQPKC